MAAEPLVVEVPSIVPIFAAPFGVTPLHEASRLNAGLLALLQDYAATRPSATPNPLCYQSRDDLLDSPAPLVLELKTALYQALHSFLGAINDFGPGQLDALQPEARAAFTIVRTDGCVGSRSYPLAAWCVLYCVAAPPPSTERRESGVLRLLESRLGTAFADATNAALRLPYLTGHFSWRPAAGSMAIFPAHLLHEIATLRADGELVLVTLRVRFRAEGQTGVGRW